MGVVYIYRNVSFFSWDTWYKVCNCAKVWDNLKNVVYVFDILFPEVTYLDFACLSWYISRQEKKEGGYNLVGHITLRSVQTRKLPSDY